MITVQHEGFEWHHHFVLFWQRFTPDFSFGGSVIGSADGMSFASSYASWALAALALLLAVRERSFRRSMLPLFLGWGAVNGMMMAVSTPLWNTVPLLEYFQFPWRFLLLSAVAILGIACLVSYPAIINPGLFLMLTGRFAEESSSPPILPIILIAGTAIVLAILFVCFRQRWKPIEFLALVSVMLLALPVSVASTLRTIYDPFVLDTVVQETIRVPANMQRLMIHSQGKQRPITTTSQDEFRPKTADIDPLKSPKYEPNMHTGAGSAKRIDERGDSRKYEVVVRSPGYFETDYLYFPGVSTSVDGKPATTRRSDPGFVLVELQSGNHEVEVFYRGTMIQAIGKYMSILAGLLALVIVVYPATGRTRETGETGPFRRTRGHP